MFRDEKIVHMAAYLIEKLGGEVERLKLIKLLYLTDRKSLEDRGYSISRDEFVSMRQGLVLSRTYDLMRVRSAAHLMWDDLIENVGGKKPFHRLRKKNPKLDALSRYDRKVMDGIIATYGQMTSKELVEHIHTTCPEWKDPRGTSKRKIPVGVKEILQELGYSKKDAEYYESHAAELDAIESGAYGF